MAIFNSFKEKVSKTAKAAAKKSSNVVEVTKLNISIGAEEEKIEKTYTKIGNIIYTNFSNGKDIPLECKEYCEEIQTHKDEIESFKRKIMNLKKVKKCPECGIELDIDSLFCYKCGKKQEIHNLDQSR